MGKNHDFDTESFSKTIKLIQDHFQTRNFNLTAAEASGAEVTEAIFKTSACLFIFISQNSSPMAKSTERAGNLLFVY